MKQVIARLFIKDFKSVNKAKVRVAYGKMAGFVGIISNLILSIAKVSIGIIIGSISILADGINNFSDAGSSLVTVIGFRLSAIPADKDHPFGHQRIEYVSGLIVSFSILAVGLLLMYNSILKIITPAELDYSWISIGILIGAIGIKIWQGFFYRSNGKLIKSKALLATSSDSFNDVIATSGVLVSVLIGKFFGINLDGYMGLVVSILIIFSGIGLVKDTISPLIGEAPTPDFVKRIKKKILSYEGVLGIHDLIVHNYGPAKTFITAHVEVDSTVDINLSHDIIDNIEHDFMKTELNLVIHMDPIDVKNPYVHELREKVTDIIKGIDPLLTFHDFRIVKGPTHTNIIFDLVVPLKYDLTPEEIKTAISAKVKELDSSLNLVITFDREAIS